MFEQIGVSGFLMIAAIGLGLFYALHAVGSGTNYTKFASPSPASFMGPEWEGRLITTTDAVEFSTSTAGASWNVGVLKPGEVFLLGIISSDTIKSEATATLSLGTPEDVDMFMIAVAMSASLQGRCFLAGASAGVGYFNTESGNRPIILMTGTATITSGTAKVTIIKARM